MSRSGPHLQGSAKGKRFTIIASQVNPAISRALVRGATDALRRCGASSRRVRVLWAPGAFELPVVAARVAKSRSRPQAVIALGALIRGQTPQYTVIAQAVAQGLEQVSVATGVPVTFGIIVAKTVGQAKARAGGARGNRGAEAALAALAVLRLFDRLT